MPIGIGQFGIVDRRAEAVRLCRPARGGGPPTEWEVEKGFAARYRLAAGDVLDSPVTEGESVTGAAGINGLPLEECEDRPASREKRHALERARPDRRVRIALDSGDIAGRMLDFASPLGIGCAGLIYGPHGSGRTSVLRAVAGGIRLHAPEIVLIVLLAGVRGEEVTHWRRLLPEADVVVCPDSAAGAATNDALRIARLTLECAQRQTELGRHVALLVDSLTALWGAMLHEEEADAQREADAAAARTHIREWLVRAGSFGGEGLLGSGLGGSLTVIATAWNDSVDMEAEEEGESHPHLRLLEHVLNDANWLAALSGEMAARRVHPALDLDRCRSDHAESLLGSQELAAWLGARRGLSSLTLEARLVRLRESLESTPSDVSAFELLAPEPETEAASTDHDSFWSGWPSH